MYFRLIWKPHITNVVHPCFLLFLSTAAGRLVNITVDDQNTDPVAGFSYEPPNTWDVGNGCQPCEAKPDPAYTLDGTWHDATYSPGVGRSENQQVQTASLQFNGSAFYVFGILTQSTSHPGGSSYLSFFIDDQLVGNYTHIPLGIANSYMYNVSLWSSDSIQPGPHTFTLQNGQTGGNGSLILLDYVVYTSEVNTTDPSSTASQSSSLTQASSSQPSMSSSAHSGSISAVPTSRTAPASHTTSIAIIASVVPIFTLALVGIVGIYLLRKCRLRRAQANQAPLASLDVSPYGSVVPFVTGDSLDDAQAPIGRRAPSAWNSTNNPAEKDMPQGELNIAEQPQETGGGIHVVVDSGFRLEVLSTAHSDVPPSYQSHWRASG